MPKEPHEDLERAQRQMALHEGRELRPLEPGPKPPEPEPERQVLKVPHEGWELGPVEPGTEGIRRPWSSREARPDLTEQEPR